MKPTQRLADFIHEVAYEEIPEEAINICKRHFLDCLGAALAEVVEQPAQIIQDYIKEVGGVPEASLVGTHLKTSTPNAAFANGLMSHAISFDDSAPSHPSVTIVPVLLSLGERYKFSGKELLAAQVVGYDIFLRFNAATKRAQGIRLAGWHPTGFFGTIASAAITSKLLKLDTLTTRMAFGIAASMSAGLSRNIGSMTMSIHAGNSAKNGIVAGLLAQKGFTADLDILESEFGMMNALCGKDQYDIDALTSDLGQPFKVIKPGINIKYYPSCWGHHRAIDALLHLAGEHNIKSDMVEVVECDLKPEDPTSRYLYPKTDHEAKYSIGYSLAIALLDGQLGIEQFFPEKISAQRTKEMMERVKHVPQEWSQDGPDEHRVKIKLKDGKEYTHGVKHRKGEAHYNPLSREELLTKYRTCARRILPEEKIERSIKIIENLENFSNTDELMEMVTVEPHGQTRGTT